MSRGAAAAIAALALVLSAGTIALATTSDHLDQPMAGSALYLSAALGFVLAGLVAARRRPANRTGKLMIAVGFSFFLGALSLASNSFLFTLGASGGAIAYGFVAVLAFGYPTGEIRERVDRLLVGATIALATVGQIVFLLVADAEELCGDTTACPENLLDVTDGALASDLVSWTINVLVVLTAIAVVARLAQRWRRASPALRRALTPVYLTTATAIVVVVARVVLADLSGKTSTAAWVLQVASLLAIPLAFLYGLLESRLARGSVGELVAALGGGAPLEPALARALDDPTLAIGYWLEAQQRYAAADGGRFEVPADGTRASTVVERGGRPVAVIVYDASLREEPELVEGVVGAAALALETQGLQAEARAQYALLRTLVDTSPGLIAHIGTDGRIRDLNAAAAAVAGLADEQEARGRFFWDVFIDPSERDDVIARFHALTPTFAAGEYENAFTNAAGERRIVFWRSAPILDETGAVTEIVSGGIDVTERQEQAEARERERAFLSAIANEAPSLLCLIDEAGVLAPHATNHAFERTLEIDAAAAGGHVLWERFVAPEEADEVREVVAGVVARGLPSGDRDNTWVTRTGRRLSVSWSCAPLPLIDDRRLFLVSGVDVTLRTHRELELQRERDATTTVLETIPSVVVVLDRAGTIRDRDVDNPRAAVNRAFREALQWRDDELVGRHFLELVAGDDGAAREALETAAQGLASHEVESDWLRADGSTVPFTWTAGPVLDVTGRREGLVLVSGGDVTERRLRELEDARRRAFVDAITETIPTFLLGLNLDGRVREKGANRAFCEAFGWTQEEIAGRPFVGTVVPAGDRTAARALAQTAQGLAHGEIESRWEPRQGDSRIVAWSARPVTAIHGGELMLVTGTDVTLRRLHEEELRASRARIVSAADEARRRLERNLHDGVQQRLVALSVTLRLAEARLGTDPTAASGILAGAREELGVALGELRDFARGIHPAILTDRGLVPALQALADRCPVGVELDAAVDRLPPAVEAAAYFVVAEALTNVVKYAQAGAATVTLRLEGRDLVVRVRDDGVGGADPARGSGLRGLADRLAALDGTLSVESAVGAGTCVLAEIPAGARIGAAATA